MLDNILNILKEIAKSPAFQNDPHGIVFSFLYVFLIIFGVILIYKILKSKTTLFQTPQEKLVEIIGDSVKNMTMEQSAIKHLVMDRMNTMSDNLVDAIEYYVKNQEEYLSAGKIADIIEMEHEVISFKIREYLLEVKIRNSIVENKESIKNNMQENIEMIISTYDEMVFRIPNVNTSVIDTDRKLKKMMAVCHGKDFFDELIEIMLNNDFIECDRLFKLKIQPMISRWKIK